MTHSLQTPIGRLTMDICDGSVLGISVDGIELIRGLSTPVRDASWQVLEESPAEAQIQQAGTSTSFFWTRMLGDETAEIATSFAVNLRPDHIKLVSEFTLKALKSFQTNRAGFVVLHPLRGVVGSHLQISHPDGSSTTTRFPVLVAPYQPAMNIVGLHHRVNAFSINFAFNGEIFEMEDQRNWSDASFKTYCRPLALPKPIQLKPDQQIRQKIEIIIKPDKDHRRSVAASAPKSPSAKLCKRPSILLAVEPDWVDSERTHDCDGLVMRIAPEKPWSVEDFVVLQPQLEAAGRNLDLEIVIPSEQSESEWLGRWADQLRRFQLKPGHVMALPEAYLRARKPGSPPPRGLSPEMAAKAAAHAFPQSEIGIGVLTNFTELNRLELPPEIGRYITYSTSAIVHAADTHSVLQTLEALPDIFASASALGQGRLQRLGLLTIGMRSNPYGAGLVPRTKGFKPMTAWDERHFEEIGAAFAGAAVLSAAEARIDAVCLAAPRGPFGLANSAGAPTPLSQLIACLNRLSGALQLTRPSQQELVAESDSARLAIKFDPRQPNFTFKEHAR